MNHSFQQLNSFSREAIALAQQFVGDIEVAQDMVRDTMLKLCEMGSLPAGHELKLWFLKAVRNHCIDDYRRQQRHQAYLIANQNHAEQSRSAAEQNPLQQLLKADQQRQLQQAFAQLSQAHRELLVLREFNDLSYGDIARITGQANGTVMSGLARARERLRQLMFSNEHALPEGD